MFDLTDRTAVVTGGAAGIGRGIVESLRAAGATVVICDLDEEAAKRTAGETGAHARGLDVTDRTAVRETFTEIAQSFGGLHILCSNAGIYPQSDLDNLDDAEWEHIFSVNVHGMFICVQEVLPHLRAAGGGRIVVTSSITGSHTGYPGWTHYGATKAAQQGFVRSAALELARDGITVNAVLPGNILTEGLKAKGEEYIGRMTRTVPMGHLGVPRDIGNAAAFFASSEANYVTGQTLVVDGGQVLPESPEAILPVPEK